MLSQNQLYRKMVMEERMEKEAILLADWMIDHDSRILELEKEHLIPKSTVHRRLTITLKNVDYDKWLQCKNILARHRKVHRKHK